MKRILAGLLLCSAGFGAVAGQVQRDKGNICENHPDKEQCLRLFVKKLEIESKNSCLSD